MKKKIHQYKRKPRKCPECGSQSIADILYGLPNFDAIKDDLKNGKIVLGGCIIEVDGSQPDWHCNNCSINLYRELE